MIDRGILVMAAALIATAAFMIGVLVGNFSAASSLRADLDGWEPRRVGAGECSYLNGKLVACRGDVLGLTEDGE